MTWLDEQWNVPDLVCYYLMQLTATVNRFFNRKSKLMDFLIKFTFTKKTQRKRLTKGDIAKADAAWLAAVGPVQHVKKPRDEL